MDKKNHMNQYSMITLPQQNIALQSHVDILWDLLYLSVPLKERVTGTIFAFSMLDFICCWKNILQMQLNAMILERGLGFILMITQGCNLPQLDIPNDLNHFCDEFFWRKINLFDFVWYLHTDPLQVVGKLQAIIWSKDDQWLGLET